MCNMLYIVKSARAKRNRHIQPHCNVRINLEKM